MKTKKNTIYVTRDELMKIIDNMSRSRQKNNK